MHAPALRAQCIWECMTSATVTGLLTGLSPHMARHVCGSCASAGQQQERCHYLCHVRKGMCNTVHTCLTCLDTSL